MSLICINQQSHSPLVPIHELNLPMLGNWFLSFCAGDLVSTLRAFLSSDQIDRSIFFKLTLKLMRTIVSNEKQFFLFTFYNL